MSNYFDNYEKLFHNYRGKKITFVEIGILDGGSLSMWREYFGPNARIIGIDVNSKCKEFEKGGKFEVIIGDQGRPEFWNSLKESLRIDLLLDDGGHTNKQQINTLIGGLDLINDGGKIVIEDTHTSYQPSFGNPSKYSLIHFVKRCIDDIHMRFNEDPSNLIAKNIHSIEIFESMICFNIDRTKCQKNSRVYNMPTGLNSDRRYHDYKILSRFDDLSVKFNFLKKSKIFRFLRKFGVSLLINLRTRGEGRELNRHLKARLNQTN